MPLNYPQYDDLISQIIAEYRRQLPQIDPTVEGSWSGAFMKGDATMAQTILLIIRDLEVQLFPQTATDAFLDLWGNYENLERLTASPSSGLISITGIVGTGIPAGTLFSSATGLQYETLAFASILAYVGNVISITRQGSIATVTTDGVHNLATGQSVTISGADQSDYNGTVSITVTSETVFQYTVTGSPTTPATGTITYEAEFASASVQSLDTGSDTNLSSGATLNFVIEITGADTTALVAFGGVSGGTDDEEEESYRTRILLSRRSQAGVFTEDQIKLAALGIAGNTRAFVVKPSATVCDADTGFAGMFPVPGQVAIYILRDNDIDIIPSPTILATTKQAIIDNGKLPAHVSEADVFVLAPDTVVVNFDFSAMDPDTSTMRTAVENQIRAFFADSVDFATDVTEASYLGAIQSTQDLQTGEFIKSFTLVNPLGDVSVGVGEIAIVGNVVFNF